MAITLIQLIPVTGSGTTVSASFTATAGNTIVVIAAAHGALSMTGSLGPDSAGNAYNSDATVSVGVSEGATDFKLLEMWSSRVVTGGSITLTYTVSATAAGLWLVIQEWGELYDGAVYGGGPGAAWIDFGFGSGAGPFLPVTLNFSADHPELVAAYGNSLPLVGVTAAFRDTLSTSYTYYPVATDSVTVPLPTFPVGATACALCVLYVGLTGESGGPPVTPPASVYLDLWVWRQLETFDSLDQDLNFPPGYERALLYALARELYLSFPAAARKYDFDELVADGEAAAKEIDDLNASNAVAEEPPI